jgi:hypothetical protein
VCSTAISVVLASSASVSVAAAQLPHAPSSLQAGKLNEESERRVYIDPATSPAPLTVVGVVVIVVIFLVIRGRLRLRLDVG